MEILFTLGYANSRWPTYSWGEDSGKLDRFVGIMLFAYPPFSAGNITAKRHGISLGHPYIQYHLPPCVFLVVYVGATQTLDLV